MGRAGARAGGGRAGRPPVGDCFHGCRPRGVVAWVPRGRLVVLAWGLELDGPFDGQVRLGGGRHGLLFAMTPDRPEYR